MKASSDVVDTPTVSSLAFQQEPHDASIGLYITVDEFEAIVYNMKDQCTTREEMEAMIRELPEKIALSRNSDINFNAPMKDIKHTSAPNKSGAKKILKTKTKTGMQNDKDADQLSVSSVTENEGEKFIRMLRMEITALKEKYDKNPNEELAQHIQREKASLVFYESNDVVFTTEQQN